MIRVCRYAIGHLKLSCDNNGLNVLDKSPLIPNMLSNARNEWHGMGIILFACQWQIWVGQILCPLLVNLRWKNVPLCTMASRKDVTWCLRVLQGYWTLNPIEILGS